MIIKLGTMVASRKWIIIIDFHVYVMFKVKFASFKTEHFPVIA